MFCADLIYHNKSSVHKNESLKFGVWVKLNPIETTTNGCPITYTVSQYASPCLETQTLNRDDVNSPLIHPNPSTNGFFTIENHVSCQVKVFNNLGHIIYRKNHTTPVISLDISGNAKGVYTIAIETDKRIYITSLIYK